MKNSIRGAIAGLFFLLPLISANSFAHSNLGSGDRNEIESPIRNVKGEILKLNKSDARQYCKNINKRIPTFKEFVDYAVSRGAEGLLSVEPPTETFNSTFYTVEGTYIFSAKGYIWNQPAQDDTEPYYWINDDADPEHYPGIDVDGTIFNKYDSFLFNRARGIGLFFVEYAWAQRPFICISR